MPTLTFGLSAIFLDQTRDVSAHFAKHHSQSFLPTTKVAWPSAIELCHTGGRDPLG